MAKFEHRCIDADALFVEDHYGKKPGEYGWRVVGALPEGAYQRARLILERPYERRVHNYDRSNGTSV